MGYIRNMLGGAKTLVNEWRESLGGNAYSFIYDALGRLNRRFVRKNIWHDDSEMNISSPALLYYDGNRIIEYHEPVWEVKQGENIVLDVPGDYTLDSCQAADGDPPDPPPGPPPGPPPILPPGPMQKRTSGAVPATKPAEVSKTGAPSLAQQSVGDESYVVGQNVGWVIDPPESSPSTGAPSFAKQRVGDGSYVVGEHAKPPTSSTTDSVYRRFKDQILAANRSYGAATVRESDAPTGKLDTTTYSGDPMGAATPSLKD